MAAPSGARLFLWPWMAGMPEMQEQFPAAPWMAGMPEMQEQFPAAPWIVCMPELQQQFRLALATFSRRRRASPVAQNSCKWSMLRLR